MRLTDIPASQHPSSRNLPESPRTLSTDGSDGALLTVGLRHQSLRRSRQLAPSCSKFLSFRAADRQLSWLSKYSLGTLNQLGESKRPASQTLFHLHCAGANHVQSQQANRLLPALARITAERAVAVVAAVRLLLDQSGLCSTRSVAAVLYSA